MASGTSFQELNMANPFPHAHSVLLAQTIASEAFGTSAVDSSSTGAAAETTPA
jgi:hypothetical protein